MEKLKFSHKIMFVSALILMLVLGSFTLHNYVRLKSQTEDSVNESLSEISRSVSQNIANWLNGKLAIVTAFADVINEDTSKASALNVLQFGKVSGSFKNTYIGKRDGEFLIDDQTVVLPADYDPRNRPWFTLVEDKRKPAFTEPYIDVTTQALTISAVSPVVDNGQLVGVAGADINMSSITNIISGIDFMGLGYAFLVTDEGKILVHPDSTYLDQPLSRLLGRSPELSANLESFEVQGKDRLISFLPIKGINNVNWYLGVSLDQEKTFSSIADFRNMALLYLFLGIIAIVILFNIALTMLMSPITELTKAVEDLSHGEGDLTRRLDVKGNDEFSKLSEYFNNFLNNIHRPIAQVSVVTDDLTRLVHNVVEETTASIHIYHDQNERSMNVAHSIAELGGASQEIAQNAASASSLASTANNYASEGGAIIQKNISSIQELSVHLGDASQNINQLNQNSENIGRILEVIVGISEQTNLLALNAAIEAARAGEAGRGFAVVADEVRQLAQRTKESTTEIESMIAGLQRDASSAVELMRLSSDNSETSVKVANTAGEQMASVSDTIASIDGVNHTVAAATEEQNTVIKNINDDIQSINRFSQQGADNLQQTLKDCQTLEKQFEELAAMVHKFVV